MPQHDMNIADAGGALVRSDINDALAALVGLSSGTTAPSTTFSYQLWFDTTNGLLKIRNAANSGWVVVASLSGSTWTPYIGGSALAAGIGLALASGAFALDFDSLSEGTAPEGSDYLIGQFNGSPVDPVRIPISLINPFGTQLLHVRDEKTQNTNGGTFTSGADRTRDLNTSKTNEISGASLASNQITLPAGTYSIYATAPAYSVGQHQALLYNVTDSTEIIRGTSQFSSTTNPCMDRSIVCGRFTLSAQKVLELRHRCNTTVTPTGFGTASNFSTEVYAEVMIWRIA